MWVYFWILYSFHWSICLSWHQYHSVLITTSFKINLGGHPVVKTPYFSGWGTKIPHAVEPIKKKKIWKSGSSSPPTFFFFFKILAIPDSLHFQMNFRILSISIKWPTGILIRLALYLQINLEKIDNFWITDLSIQYLSAFI